MQKNRRKVGEKWWDLFYGDKLVVSSPALRLYCLCFWILQPMFWWTRFFLRNFFGENLSEFVSSLKWQPFRVIWTYFFSATFWTRAAPAVLCCASVLYFIFFCLFCFKISGHSAERIWRWLVRTMSYCETQLGPGNRLTSPALKSALNFPKRGCGQTQWLGR